MTLTISRQRGFTSYLETLVGVTAEQVRSRLNEPDVPTLYQKMPLKPFVSEVKQDQTTHYVSLFVAV